MTTNAGTILWLTRASELTLKPTTPKAARLARSAMASFWASDRPAYTYHSLEQVFVLGHSVPDLQVSYIYSN